MSLSANAKHYGIAALFTVAGWMAGTAPLWADDAVIFDLTLRDHRFTPSEIIVPTGQPLILRVKNLDPTPEEFESSALKIEKIVVGGGSIMIHLRAIAAGRYPFIGEFHDDTAQGVVIAQDHPGS